MTSLTVMHLLTGSDTALTDPERAQAKEMAGLQYARQLFKLTDARFVDLHEALLVAGEKSE